MSKDHRNNHPLLLMILDGWGYSEEKEWNAIYSAQTPNFDRLWNEYPHTTIGTSGANVGLPGTQMGNSEVGHLNIGAGRVVYQEFTRISRAIKTGSFYSNATLTEAIDKAIETQSTVHIMGLLSPGGVHSHEDHIHAMMRLAVEKGAPRVCLHAFLDGRDTPPQSAMESLRMVEELCEELGNAKIVSMIGRYYAMDRDHRWSRVQSAYDLISNSQAEYTATSATEGLEMAYQRGETDEFVKATSIGAAGSACRIEDNDVLIFMNFRSDRAREITRPFVEEDFSKFPRSNTPTLGSFVSLTEYSADYAIPVAFPPDRLKNVFGEYIAQQGLHQLRIAETEKYAHVTFFFNGGREEAFEGENRILIPSPEVATYDLQPEMSAFDLQHELINALQTEEYKVIICNFANPDMVGHTGKFEPTVEAIEALDRALSEIILTMEAMGGEILITADHGNAELMRNTETGQPHTAHTSNPVPLIYFGPKKIKLAENGCLADIAPTMLTLLGLEIPYDMTGHSLILEESKAES